MARFFQNDFLQTLIPLRLMGLSHDRFKTQLVQYSVIILKSHKHCTLSTIAQHMLYHCSEHTLPLLRTSPARIIVLGVLKTMLHMKFHSPTSQGVVFVLDLCKVTMLQLHCDCITCTQRVWNKQLL